MQRLTIFILGLLFPITALFAQNEMDALRYSMTDLGGTARFSAMGGAFGALGGDFSALSINPAGLGVYRSSEINFTPAFSYNETGSTYFGQTETDTKYSFQLSHAGMVLALPVGNQQNPGGWRFVNIGLGINQLNNFNNRWIAEGFNNTNSLMTDFVERAREAGSVERLSDYDTGLAWDTYLIDLDGDGRFFVDMESGQVLQRQETNLSGSIREFVASVAANYNDKVYLGMSMGVPVLSYREENIYKESDVQNTNAFFNELTYRNSFETQGSGVRFKLGAIVRAGSFLRLGASFHSPTFYQLKDKYRASMLSDLNLDPDEYPDYDDESRFAQSPEGLFNYELQTPLKAVGSLGFLLGNAGLISLDYEYIDYTSARLRSDEYSFSEENRRIGQKLNSQHGIRLGAEVRLDPLVLRGGYAHYTNPYAAGINDATRTVLSAGLGFRESDYFIDFAYTYSLHNEDYYLYAIAPRAVEREMGRQVFRLSFGWRF